MIATWCCGGVEGEGAPLRRSAALLRRSGSLVRSSRALLRRSMALQQRSSFLLRRFSSRLRRSRARSRSLSRTSCSLMRPRILFGEGRGVAAGVAGFAEILPNVLGIRDSILLLCFSLVSKPKNFATCCSVLQCVAGCALFFRDREQIREPTLSACKHPRS